MYHKKYYTYIIRLQKLLEQSSLFFIIIYFLIRREIVHLVHCKNMQNLHFLVPR